MSTAQLARCQLPGVATPTAIKPSRHIIAASKNTVSTGVSQLVRSSRALSGKVSTRRRSIVVRAENVASGVVAGPVTDDTFEELVLKSPVPVLIDFWAPWCGPCRMIAPLIDEIAAEYGDRLRAFKLNTDESPSIATTYGIRSIPTVMVFKNGEKMDTVIGAVAKPTLVQTIEKYLD